MMCVCVVGPGSTSEAGIGPESPGSLSLLSSTALPPAPYPLPVRELPLPGLKVSS